MSKLIDQITVNGLGMGAKLKDQVSTGTLKVSAGSVASLDFTIIDRNDLHLTREVRSVFREGTTLEWLGYTFALTGLETGGGANGPMIEVSATSEAVDKLKTETGGHSWGDIQTSEWFRTQITQSGAKPVVQPGLGIRPAERKEPQGDHVKAESTWDVLVELAKQVGAWVVEYEDTIIVGKPSWVLNNYGTRRYKIVWNSWTDHTDALVAAPQFTWDKDTRPWEGQEKLVLKIVDPGTAGGNNISKCRPGDIIDFIGAAAPSEDAAWIVRDVQHYMYDGAPATITCWRPIDPPEIVDKAASGSDGGDGTAGVPNGPIGTMGWQGEQLRNAAEIVKESQRRGLPTLAAELAVACAMGESSLRYTPYGDAAGPDSVGLFQQRDSWGSRADRLVPAKAAGFFFDALTAQPYKTNYANGANALPASNIGAAFVGPGNSANSASVTIHRVQANADPYHYARFWGDAQKVVKACLDAGANNAGSAPKATGPMGARIDQLMKSYEGRNIDVDGFGWMGNIYQCVDLAAKYVTDMYGIPMVRGNGVDYWNHPGLLSKFSPVPASKTPRKGDIASWSGAYGEYRNGGYGHVAIFSHIHDGRYFFLSQNPGPSRTQPLERSGIQGWMRPKS